VISWRAFAESFVTLAVIMDPIGTAPIFVALTGNQDRLARRRSALQASIAAAAVIALFALFGQLLLDYLRVSLESLTIAGGLLLLLVALEMFRGDEMEPSAGQNVALVPLATPLLAGPGAIATVMVLVRRHAVPAERLGVIVGIAAALALVAIGLLLAGRIASLLRPSAVRLLTRVFGLLLSAIAVQLIVDAVRSLTRAATG
jgi:multiple antibiotic resistance protein